jgi:hypothetical protein
MYVNHVLESEWTFSPYPPDAWNTIAQAGMRPRLEGTQARGAGESPAQDANVADVSYGEAGIGQSEHPDNHRTTRRRSRAHGERSL